MRHRGIRLVTGLPQRGGVLLVADGFTSGALQGVLFRDAPGVEWGTYLVRSSFFGRSMECSSLRAALRTVVEVLLLLREDDMRDSGGPGELGASSSVVLGRRGGQDVIAGLVYSSFEDFWREGARMLYGDRLCDY